MATPEQIAALRVLIAEPDNAEPYTDEKLGAIIDAAGGNNNQAAYEIWISKAASYSTLVDISEGGSSRKNGQLQEQALVMARLFGDRVEDTSPTLPGAGIKYRRLVRP